MQSKGFFPVFFPYQGVEWRQAGALRRRLMQDHIPKTLPGTQGLAECEQRKDLAPCPTSTARVAVILQGKSLSGYVSHGIIGCNVITLKFC